MPSSPNNVIHITAPLASVIISLPVSVGQQVQKGEVIAIVESMKMQTNIEAPANGVISDIKAAEGDTLQARHIICSINDTEHVSNNSKATTTNRLNRQTVTTAEAPLQYFKQRQHLTSDAARPKAINKRHAKAYRSARENLTDLCDPDSFIEYGQFAVAAQRRRTDIDTLRTSTAADGILTGLATINNDLYDDSSVAVVVNDYTVLAGTQGYFHHKKLDRILEMAEAQGLPIVMYTEGGGGRPGDTDVDTTIAGLNIHSFSTWARLSGLVPKITVNNGYCFAGNAALFGCSDIRIATKSSCIGMAGPAMIEGGGLGTFKPTDIGPVEVQTKNGVIDLVADDESHATALAKQALGYFQGKLTSWQCEDQGDLRSMMPEDRRFTYNVHRIINTLVDSGSFLELKPLYGQAMIIGFARIEGRPVGILANNCKVLGGAIDTDAAEKAAGFINLCSAFGIAVVSLSDTPGFMVGPDSEKQGAVNSFSQLFVAGAKTQSPIVAIILRKGYGLGSMAMTGGSYMSPVYTASWPTGEFGGMGLEGAVKLGFKKELEAETDPNAREALFNSLLQTMYDQGKATEAASFLEIDAVIDPADTRRVIINALQAAKFLSID